MMVSLVLIILAFGGVTLPEVWEPRLIGVPGVALPEVGEPLWHDPARESLWRPIMFSSPLAMPHGHRIAGRSYRSFDQHGRRTRTASTAGPGTAQS